MKYSSDSSQGASSQYTSTTTLAQRHAHDVTKQAHDQHKRPDDIHTAGTERLRPTKLHCSDAVKSTSIFTDGSECF